MQEDLPIREGRVIPAAALEVRTSRASGPGGQHVNKTESKVTLALDLDKLDGWPDWERARLRSRLGSRLTLDGRLQIHAESHRRQARNLEEARRRMAAIIEDALRVQKARRATQPSKGAKRRRVEDKRRAGEKKRLRGKISAD